MGVVVDSSEYTVTSLASSTSASKLHTFTLPVGRWIVNVSVRFPSNSTGRRHAELRSSGATSEYGLAYMDEKKAVTSGQSFCSFTFAMKTESEASWEIWGLQNSGSALSNVLVRINWIGMTG